jgi:excinuclease ABC subunit C
MVDRQAILDKVRQFPATPGVYLMKDDKGIVLYVGKAANLRARVSSYFQQSADLSERIRNMVEQVDDVDFLDVETEAEALLTEARLIKDIQPRYNVRLTDDKTFPYLEITTRDDFPGVYITRTPRAKGTRLYGPFTNVYALRESLSHLQKVFKFRTCHLEIDDGDEKRRFFRPCLLHAIKQCTAPCADRIVKADYRRDVKRLQRFLDSKRSVVMRQLEREMKEASAAMEFERAAQLRDQLKALEALKERGRPDEHLQPELFHPDSKRGLGALAKTLDLDDLPRTIEGFDIATLGGGETVGSSVFFLDGVPFKNRYRRYRIRRVEGVDDFASMQEVVNRRYRDAGAGTELFPDIVLIDGGAGQLGAVMEVFEQMEFQPTAVISLAKREEEIYVPGRRDPIKLPRNNAGLQLLQAVRDEAHRFAQHYHHILRRKAIFEEEVRDGRRPPRGKEPGPPEAGG